MKTFSLVQHLPRLPAIAMIVIAASALPQAARADDAAWTALQGGGIVLFRHANAPGTVDPQEFTLGDCTTQRNLDEAGRDQARAIGGAFATNGIAVDLVLTSQWCRARDTAELAFPGLPVDEPAFNSFFDDRSEGPGQTARALAVLSRWQSPQVWVVVTHQVNITALTGVVPVSGEGIVVRAGRGGLDVLGRIAPQKGAPD
jgi:phosphohistidine phosphatase SixA